MTQTGKDPVRVLWFVPFRGKGSLHLVLLGLFLRQLRRGLGLDQQPDDGRHQDDHPSGDEAEVDGVHERPQHLVGDLRQDADVPDFRCGFRLLVFLLF